MPAKTWEKIHTEKTLCTIVRGRNKFLARGQTSSHFRKEITRPLWGKDQDSEQSIVTSLRGKPAAQSQVIKSSPNVSAWT